MDNEWTFDEEDSQGAEINMSPLIDMVFILLIFFIITTNFNRQTGVEVSKPKAQSAVSQGQRVLLVGITREGTVHAFGRQISQDRLEGLVKKEVARYPEMSVVIVADREAPIGKAVEVMDHCTMAGAGKVSIAADRE